MPALPAAAPSLSLCSLAELFSDRSEHDQAIQLIQEISHYPVQDEITVLLEDAAWGLVNRPVNDLRRGPSIYAERVSQALLGEALQVLQTGAEWSQVRLEKDGYIGWLQNAAIYLCSEDFVRQYQAACNARVQTELLPARLISSPQSAPGELSGKLPFGLPVAVLDFQDETADLRLPGGSLWRVANAGLLPSFYSPAPDEEGIRAALKLIRRLIGVPYLWGGRSPFGYDCSGLAQTFWGFLGVAIPRDADQQFQACAPVSGLPIPGDLLFFGEADQISGERFGNISHVAISLGGADMIHANGAAWGVSINSLDPASPLYRPWLAENLAGVGRYS